MGPPSPSTFEGSKDIYPTATISESLKQQPGTCWALGGVEGIQSFPMVPKMGLEGADSAGWEHALVLVSCSG